MRRFFRRSILWLLPVVILPLGALGVMQYRFLRTLEQKTVSAERNWLRNSLETATEEVEQFYRKSATAALTMSDAKLREVTGIGAHFEANRVRGARTFFAMRFKQGMYEVGYFDTHGREKTPTPAEAEAVKLGTVAWHVAHKWDRLLPQPALVVDDRDPAHRMIMMPVVDESMHLVGITGVVLNSEATRKCIEGIVAGVLKKRYPDKDMQLRVGERFAPEQGGRDFVTHPIGFAFNGWRIGIRDGSATPEELARVNFRHNAMWTGGAFIMLLGAVALAIGALARQMRLSQMKSDFVSNVSHELRTPLSSIRVFGEYMRLGRVTGGEKIQQYGEYIEAESRRLTQLINNILDFSRIESAEKKYRFCETDIVDLVKQTVTAFEMPQRDLGVAISFHSGPVPAGLLLVDKDALAQVVFNLLDNAVKYSNGGKAIDVAVRATVRDVKISVRDHGIGIPATEQKKIFEKFYRVGSGLVHDVKGSGLGLSIVEHVVKAHGGRVDVESEPGQGSTFTIVLPLKSVYPERSEGSRAARIPPIGEGEVARDPSLRSG